MSLFVENELDKFTFYVTYRNSTEQLCNVDVVNAQEFSSTFIDKSPCLDGDNCD